MVDGAAPCDADIPTRESPRKTQPPTHSDPVAAAPPNAPVFKSCARIEKVISLFPLSCPIIMKILTNANYHDK
jgi:hypothetical protein